LKWAIELGTATDDVAAGVAVDPDGDIIMTGNFTGTLQCGQTQLSSVGRTDIFLARLTTDGTYQWCRRLGGSSDDTAGGIAVDDSGLIAVTGAFSGTTNLGGGDLKSDGIPSDAFVGSGTTAAIIGHVASARGYEEGPSFDRFGGVVAAGYLASSVTR
jgi:hypothetical protein